MGWPLSRSHNRAVPSTETLARMRSFGDIAIASIMLVCSTSTAICSHLVVFHVLIELSYDAEISVFPSLV
jgi:hypothetical protein